MQFSPMHSAFWGFVTGLANKETINKLEGLNQSIKLRLACNARGDMYRRRPEAK